jgi:hypothetical protein
MNEFEKTFWIKTRITTFDVISYQAADFSADIQWMIVLSTASLEESGMHSLYVDVNVFRNTCYTRGWVLCGTQEGNQTGNPR